MAAKAKEAKRGSGFFSRFTGLFSPKGKEKKLVNEYEEIVQRNPEDHRARIKLGEWYAKQGSLDRATEEFLTVAQAYKNDGFNLKAIATYKQILKITTSNTAIILELADLYKRQGLIRDAINEYHEAINIFQAEGRKPEVLQILKRMSELSHDSVDLGMRLVDIYSAEGYAKEATEQLLVVATVYNEREEKEEAIAVYKRLLGLYPDVPSAIQALGGLFEERGTPSKASMLKDLLEEGRSKPSLFKNSDRLAGRLRTIDTSDSGFIIEEEGTEGGGEAEVGELDKEIESFIQSYSWKEESGEEVGASGSFSTIEEVPSEEEESRLPAARHREEPRPSPVRAGGIHGIAEEDEVDVAVLSEDAFQGAEEIDDVPAEEEIEPAVDVEAEIAAEEPSWEPEESGDDIGDVVESVPVGGARGPQGFEEEYEPTEGAEEVDGEGAVCSDPEPADDRVRLKSERDYLEKGWADKDDKGFDLGSHEAFTSAGFERVFDEFRKGLEKQIGEEDAETHYNLGIAYKEMALHEEAIHEFEVAMRSPDSRADSLTMIGMCFEDIGDYEQSIEYFLEAIQCDDLPRDKVMGLNYEVGLALEAVERYEEAYDYFSKVYAMDENYRSVKKKLADLLKELKT